MKKLLFLSISLLVMTLVSCSEGWSVSGKVENTPDSVKISIESLGPNGWYNIDSISLGSDGSFKYVSPEGSPYPDIYRISLNGRSIYFPIDSLESVNIIANARDFDRDYTLSGSPLAEQMVALDKQIADMVASKGVEATLNDSVLKHQLCETIIADKSGIISYYLINKNIGNQPLFSMSSPRDVRILGAVANKFHEFFPNDPRTPVLAKRFSEARPGKKMQANVTGLIDLKFYDTKGRSRSLLDVAKSSGVTLLSFTSYNMEPSVAYNVELNRIYDKYKNNNIEIYQISIDDNEVDWRTKAQNLPWVAVRANPDEVQALLSMYNVGVLPTTFVIDSNSDLVERIDGDPSAIEPALRKHLK